MYSGEGAELSGCAAYGYGNDGESGHEGRSHKNTAGIHTYGLSSFKNFGAVDHSTGCVSECCHGDVTSELSDDVPESVVNDITH